MIKIVKFGSRISGFHCSNAIPVSICVKKLASFDLVIFDPQSWKKVSRFAFVQILIFILSFFDKRKENKPKEQKQ